MKKKFLKHLPKFLKPTLKKIYFFTKDSIAKLKGRDSMIPPTSMSFVGGGDFELTGKEFKKYFVEIGNLRPNHRVLDVGCGIGRMAIPLTSYLSTEGSYWGFDIVAKGIKWCQNYISPKYINFQFLHCDVYNKHYNKEGKVLAEDYRFPFDNQFFDFVFLTSVFTHMLPLAMENYLNEISRVLKPGGQCFVTFFLLNKESEDLIRSGESALNFRFRIEDCLTINNNDPESAIAYREEFVKQLFTKHGLRIIEPIHYGSWCKRSAFLSYQDIIIAMK